MFQSSLLSSSGTCRVTLLSTSVKSYWRQPLFPPSAKAIPAYRDKKACGPLSAVKCPGEQLQPCVVPVHDQLPRAFGLHLRQPCVLGRQARALVPFVEVEHDIEERGDRAGGDRFEAGHRDGGGGGVRREGKGSAIADQPGCLSAGAEAVGIGKPTIV